MKKFIVLLMLSTALFAENEAEQFFYSNGYDRGYDKVFDDGVKQGQKIAKEALKKYADTIKAREIGKYLIESKKLTAPEVWQTKTENGLNVTIMPSVIEDELDIDAIFEKFGAIPTKSDTDKSGLTQGSSQKPGVGGDDLNSVFLTDRDANSNSLPSKASRGEEMITLNVEKSYKNKEILNKANLVYSETDDHYQAVFFSRSEKKQFCNDFRELCKGGK